MALIKCSECGQMVSDKASSCPKCGNPIDRKSNGSWKKPIMGIVILLIIIAGAFGVWNVVKGNTQSDIQITKELSEAVHRYSDIGNFSEGMAAVCRNEKWGFINSRGEEVIPCKYIAAFDFSEGLACVFVSEENASIEFIDHKGNSVIKGYYGDGLFYEALYFHNGKSKVYDKDGKEIWIDKKGNVVSIPQDADSYGRNPKSYTFEENGKHGIKDSLNNIIVAAKYSNISDFSEGLAAAYLYNGQTVCGYVDKDGHDTFTKEDWEKLSLYEEQQRIESQRAEEERQRQAEEARNPKTITIYLKGHVGNYEMQDYEGNYGAKYGSS